MTGILNRRNAAVLILAVAGLVVPTTKLAAADWQIEVVDSSGFGKSTSMKIDNKGNVHVAYIIEDGLRYPLKYAFWDKRVKRWFTMTVDELASTCSLVLDSKQNPHISYVDYGTGSGSRLRYAFWDGTAWQRKPIGLNSDVIAYFSSIVLDAKDAPSISFYEYRGPKLSEFHIRLRNVTWNGQYWDLKTVDPQEGSGKFNAMAIDSKGGMHLAYGNVSANTAGLRYAYGVGGSWKKEIVDDLTRNNGEVVGYSTSLALDKDGNPHVCYMNVSTPQVRYAFKKDGRWQIQIVDSLVGTAYPDRNSIVVDDQGRVYLGYYDPGQGVLKVAHREGQKWIVEIVDGGGAGLTSSLDVRDGVIWISYADPATASLKIARSTVGTPQTSETSPLSKAGQE